MLKHIKNIGKHNNDNAYSIERESLRYRYLTANKSN